MTINDATIKVERTESYVPTRLPTRRMIAIGATTLVAAIAALAAVVQPSGQPTSQPAVRAAPTVDARSITEDLVNRGLIPRESLEPAALSRDDIVRDLVDRGLVPAATLDD